MNFDKHTQKDRVYNKLWDWYQQRKDEIISRPFVKPDDLQPGQFVLSGNMFIFVVDKVTPKTVFLKEYFNNPNELSQIGSTVRVKKTDFTGYRLTSETEIQRVKEMGYRMEFVRRYNTPNQIERYSNG